MSFTCKSNPDFIGRSELQRLKGLPLEKRLVTFTLPSYVPLLGNESIYRDGKFSGYVNRAGVSHTTQRGIAFGYIELLDGEKPGDAVGKSKFEIDVMGDLIPASPSLKPVLPGKSYVNA